MRYILAFCLIVALLTGGQALAELAEPETSASATELGLKARCPKTTITDQNLCFRCHTSPNFRLKEAPLGEGKLLGKYLASEGGKIFFKYELGDVGQLALNDIIAIRDYAVRHPGMIDRLVIDILSPGGSLFHAWHIIGVFRDLKSRGIEIETRCMGFAASAAFLIFASGNDRVTTPTTEFMWHECRSWAFFDEKNPSKLEDEARIFRHLQNTANKHLASVSKASKVFLDKHIDKDELWLTGREMLKHGFADRLIE